MSDLDKNNIEMLEEDEELEKTSYKMHTIQFDKIEFPKDSLENPHSEEKEASISFEKSTEVVEKENSDTLSTDIVDKNDNNSRVIMMIVMFIVILLIVYFLPNISDFFNNFVRDGLTTSKNITTGVLECSLLRDSESFSYEYESEFTFSNNKLTTLNYKYTVIGDRDVNEDELNTFHNKCVTLKKMVNNFSGIQVSCNLKKDRFSQTQVIDYLRIDEESVTSAYLEAGGIYPNFKLNQNIDEIERNMKASGYVCKRVK